MKKTVLIVSLLVSCIASSQVRMTGTGISASNSSAFIDASSNTTNNGTVGNGKGLVFPRVDLSTFTFVGSTGVPNNYPYRYDGMIVYNTKDGGAANVGTTTGTLKPGFWFYENKSATTSGGTWKSIGSDAIVTKDITATEIELSTKIDGVQLYAIKGSFVASGTSAIITITKPTGMTGYYSITIYKDGKTYRNSIISFDINSNSDNVVTGYGSFSEVYPAGTYNYVLEYFK